MKTFLQPGLMSPLDWWEWLLLLSVFLLLGVAFWSLGKIFKIFFEMMREE